MNGMESFDITSHKWLDISRFAVCNSWG